ncbi:isomerase [Beutenbergia cavernae DSM 12333]|uniref:Isomerase n=1 Tax=Beutenbergia cavernae (strain ATCC BAA-8 / DSM 12333 / CCUG 43141 / JCM 11478 / NBRC 16432 / NCIMB 13614 / HKI 0122) TaxID=471853 RepID=C5C4W0_BEUC1|nr:hypothetical protein [Beutenbergia cavernae]ACQ80088.1 isomerase [Beutenbergia cavernae DSM 12333]
MTATDLPPALARYVQFWNTEPPEVQTRLGTEVFTADVEYHAVPGVLTGAPALVDFRTQFVGHVGPATFRPRHEADHHHDRIRLAWEIVLEDGTSFAEGTDTIVVAPDGKIRSVTSFLDRAPEGFDADGHHAGAGERR